MPRFARRRWSIYVDWRTMESKVVKGVHVLGDATLSASGMPKSGHMANAHAKVCAAALVDLCRLAHDGIESSEGRPRAGRRHAVGLRHAEIGPYGERACQGVRGGAGRAMSIGARWNRK